MDHFRKTSVSLGAVLFSVLADAATLVVDLSVGADYTDIQSGIDAASNGDTVLVKPGEYVLTAPIDFNRLHVPGDQGTPPLKNIEMRSEKGAAQTVIRMSATPANSDRAFVVVFENGEGLTSVLDGFTITGGYWAGPKYEGAGGVLCRNGASPSLKSCIVTGNRSTDGAIGCRDGSPEISDSLIIDNSSAAVTCRGGSPSFYRCILSRNGAGVDCDSTGRDGPRLMECEISGNGWGVWAYIAGIQLEKCRIVGNSGWGIRSDQDYGVTLEDCVISDNGAEGVYCDDSNPILTRCRISRNGRRGIYAYVRSKPKIFGCLINGNRGDGVYSIDSTITVQKSTIVDNSGWGLNSSVAGVEGGTVEDSIIWGNASGSVRDGWDFPDEALMVKRSCTDDLLPWPGVGNINQDPYFVLPGADYGLLSGSPAIDATGSTESATDLNGLPRPCGPSNDMGAYERCAPGFYILPSPAGNCRAQASIFLYSPADVRGLTFGLSNDPAIAQLEEIRPGSACEPSRCDEFLSDPAASSSQGAEAGGTLGVIFNLNSPLPPGRHEIAKFVYLGKRRGLAPLTFTASLGTPPIELLVTTRDGGKVPQIQDGYVQVSESCFMPPRGDLEENRRLNLTDVIWILLCLFGVEPDKCPRCLDAADISDDGTVDILDPVLLIDYLFRRGAPPPAPFPTCGFDLTEDSLPECGEVSC